ncbi:exopolyphosphatase [Clostridia bacterium]|nr:exopolyphosphatase [Clostridia bacterium]GHV14373.1 exopolyphosphatase [Clostridia bacterium]
MNLVTRSDFDGLACATVLKEVGLIDTWTFVHPKDLQDGKIEVTANDVLTNVPFVPGCGLWFDHHSSEEERVLRKGADYKGESRVEKSAARIVYEYYGGKRKMPHFAKMITAVDAVDSGDLDVYDILNPSGWILLGFLMDPRTGLGRYRDFRISNYALMEKLIEDCRINDIEEILSDYDVKERIEKYDEQNNLFKIMLLEHSKVHGNCIVTDLRDVSPIYTGNRFLVYAVYPEQNISIWIVDGRAKQNVSIAVGHSILQRTSGTDVGSLMLKYGGGGHHQVGTCQVPYNDCDKVVGEILAKINEDG